jgi:hypothetical protein
MGKFVATSGENPMAIDTELARSFAHLFARPRLGRERVNAG